jgi:hypothetical protein
MESKTEVTEPMLVFTREVNSKVADDIRFTKFVINSLRRHQRHDWGDMCKEDKQANDEALKTGDRLFSAYKNGEDKIWIITEADRSVTTVLFPDEY